MTDKPQTIAQYQALVQQLVVERGYDEETVSEVFGLLVEEVGELAKAIRKLNGQKVHLDSHVHDVRDELADVFWLVLDLSNRLDVDLAAAFVDKELKNQKRKEA